jgi:anti-anti-sigma factor
MSNPESTGSILHGTHDGVQVLRFIGEVRHTLGPALEHFLDQLLEQRPSGIVFDLSETAMIDSTCLGLLAHTALRLRDLDLGKATVVSPRPDIREVLRSMSFDRLFRVVGEPPPATGGPTRPLETHKYKEDDILAAMLGAHRVLMSLSEQNRLQFKDVVDALEQESEARQGAGNDGKST